MSLVLEEFYTSSYTEPVDNNYLSNYCSSENGYKANSPTRSYSGSQAADVSDDQDSANELVENFDVKLFPNPTSNKLFLQSRKVIKTENIEIYSSLGTKISGIEPKNVGFAYLNGYEVDVTNLPAGMYYLKMESGGKLLTREFIVMR